MIKVTFEGSVYEVTSAMNPDREKVETLQRELDDAKAAIGVACDVFEQSIEERDDRIRFLTDDVNYYKGLERTLRNQNDELYRSKNDSERRADNAEYELRNARSEKYTAQDELRKLKEQTAFAVNPKTKLDALIDAVSRGEKIQAIKLYREMTGEGLKESKDKLETIPAAAWATLRGAPTF